MKLTELGEMKFNSQDLFKIYLYLFEIYFFKFKLKQSHHRKNTLL